MLELTSKKIIVLAIILALITSFITYKHIKSLEQEHKIPMEKVVIANKNIDQGTIITSEMVSIKEIPEGTRHFKALKDVEKAVGKIAADKLVKGEQILTDRLIQKEKSSLSYSIPEDKRALTVGVTEIIGVAGMTRPGDRVDVIASFMEKELKDRVTKTIASNLLVLAVGNEKNLKKDKNPEDLTSITLAVTPKQAEKIVFSEENGVIRLVLRSAFNKELYKNEPVKIEDVLGITSKQK